MRTEEQLRQIHQALCDHDNDAWQAIYQTYTEYVSYWINRTDSTHILSQQDRRDLVQETFSKLFQAGGTRCLHFPELAAFYAYLRLCARSVTLDAMTPQYVRHQQLETRAEAISSTDPALLVIKAEEIQELTRMVLDQVRTEQERIVVTCWLNDVPPDAILQRYGYAFPDARLLHYIQKSLRTRLTRCMVTGEQTRESSPLSAVGMRETGTVIYHQQMSFCGKMRCRKCREGIGHGPYWYAYFLRNGRTIRQYIGKTLPEHVEWEPVAYATTEGVRDV